MLNKLKDKMKRKIMAGREDDKMNIDDDYSYKNKNNENQKKGDELWRVGIICKKDCYYLTQEILKILEDNGYEWKIISSSYKIKCRKKQDDSMNGYGGNNSTLSVLIQIFGDVDPEQKDEFLVDLHKLSGPVMEFLEFSSTFISAIQKLGLIVFK